MAALADRLGAGADPARRGGEPGDRPSNRRRVSAARRGAWKERNRSADLERSGQGEPGGAMMEISSGRRAGTSPGEAGREAVWRGHPDHPQDRSIAANWSSRGGGAGALAEVPVQGPAPGGD